MSKRVFVSTSSFGKVSERPLKLLHDAGLTVELNPHGRKLHADEVVPLVKGCVGLVAGTEPLKREALMQLAPTLKVISRVGVGVDKIDHDAAAELNIAVRNTPSAHVDPVAELALGGILAGCRHMATADRTLRGGTWKKPMGQLLQQKTVGFVGYGQVARSLHKLVRPFGVSVVACDPALSADDARAAEVELVSIEQVFERADVVSAHLPGGAATKGLIHRGLLDRMPAHGIFVNTARGDVVVEGDLVDWLRARPHSFAYLDVFAKEPYEGPLVELDNVLVTPHIGSYAREGRERMETEAVENLLAVLGATA